MISAARSRAPGQRRLVVKEGSLNRRRARVLIAALLGLAVLVSCSKPAGRSSGGGEEQGPAGGKPTATLGYPGDWDQRTDLVPSEPVDLARINASFKRQEAVSSGELERGSVDLAKSAVQYYTRSRKSGSSAGATAQVPPESEPLAVVDYGPEGELPIEMRRPTIYVMFNLPIVPMASLGEPITSSPIMTIEPHVDGIYRWYGTRTLSFEPAKPLVDLKKITVTIEGDTASLGGRRLGKTVSFELYTETVKIVNFYPGADPDAYLNKHEVPTAQARRVVLEFNEEVDPGHIARFLSVTAGGREVGFTVARPEYPERLATRTPRAALLTLDRDPPENTQVTITLADGASPRSGYPSRKGDQKESYHTVTPFRFLRLSSYAYDLPRSNKAQAVPVYAGFSHPVADTATPRDLSVTVNGKQVLPVSVEVFDRTLRINLEGTQPGDTVAVRVSSELTDVYGRPLGDGRVQRTVKLPTPYPYVSFPRREENLLEAAFAPKFIWEARNVLKGDFGIGRASEIDSGGWKPEMTKAMEVGSWKPNRVIYDLVDLAPYMNSDGFGRVYGRYSATLDTTSSYNRQRRGSFSIEVTDLGVTTRYAYNRFVVWVNRLSTGAPVADAKVTIAGEHGYERSTPSDDQGLAVFDLAPGEFVANFMDIKNRTEHPLITVEKGSDRASFHSYNSQDSYTATTYGHSSPSRIESPRARVMIFTDRGLYKPGEEIALRGIHWNQSPGGFAPYRGPYSLELKDPRSGEAIWTTSGTASFSGGFAHRFRLPEKIEPGEYYIRYEAGKQRGGVSFTIAQFRRLSFQVRTSIPERTYYQGESLSATVRASYLAGGALPAGGYSYYWTRVPTPYSPPGTKWSGWVFGPGSWEGERTLSQGKGTLGGDGSALIAETTEGQIAEGAAYRYTLETTVQDVDRQAIASRASVTVHPASFYLGARFAGGSADGWWSRFVATGQKVRLEADLVAVDGSVERSEVPVEIRLTRGTWKSTQQQGVYGRIDTRWEYVEEEVEKASLPTRNGSLSWSFSVKEAGTYLLSLSAADAKGRQAKTVLRFYATGSSWVRRATESPSDINLVPDKSLYSPGDTARILVQSPLPEGRYLMTIEREGISEEKIITLEGSQALIEVPVKESYLPVFYVALSSFTKREAPPSDYFEPDLGKPRGLFGIAGLRVSTKPVELSVDVLPLSSSYKPGEKADVVVRVTRDGKPVPNAEVTILAVDRGVLDLIDYHVPNPLDFFYDPYNFPLAVHGDDSRRLLLKPVAYDTSTLVGGDDDKMKTRKDFNPLALFEPFIATDSNGLAKVSFTLPDTLTTYRLTAVALRENRLGYAEDELLVQNPINVRAALPRKMRLRDTAAGSAILQNLTRETQPVEVTASSDILTVSGEATKRVRVPAGGVYELPFLFAAERAGEGTVTFTARSPVLNERLEEKMTVEQPLIKEAFTTVGALSGATTDEREGLVLSSEIAPGYGDLTIQAGSTLRPYLDPVMSRLLDWQPWSSRYVHLVSSFASVYRNADMSRVGALMADLASRQLPGGGIYTGSWDRGPRFPDPFVSLVTAQFLKFASARSVSFEKMPEASKLVGYLGGLEEVKQSAPFRAYLAYVLSLYGKATAARLSRTEALEDSLGLGGYGLLAQAYLAAGDERSARRVYARSKSFVMIGTQTVDLKQTYEAADYWSSMVAELALLLKNAAALKEDPGFIQRLAGSLNRSERHWQSYNDDLWTLLAFIPILDAEGSGSGTATLSAAIGQTSLASLALTPERPSAEKHLPFSSPPLASLPRDTTMSLDLRRSGPSPVYYSTIMRYALPSETAAARDEGIGVFEQIETLDGEVVKDGKLTIGETYRVRVNLETPKRRRQLELFVPVPSGAEIVDPSFVTTGRYLTHQGTDSDQIEVETVYGDTMRVAAEGYGLRSGLDWYWYFYRPDSYALDNMMVYRWTDFYAGRREVSFLIRVTTPGVYPTPPPTADLVMEPEVFGRGEGSLFVVEP